MLISFSGAQSTGKSTLLQACKKLPIFKGYTFVDEVTRRVKKEAGVEINNTAANYDYAQILIIADHVKNTTLKNAVLDRCILDGFVYTQYLYDMRKVSSWTYEFAQAAYLDLVNRYDIVFYTDPSIPLVDDGVRSIDLEFRTSIVEHFNVELKFLRERAAHKKRIIRVKGSPEQRLKTVVDTVTKFQNL